MMTRDTDMSVSYSAQSERVASKSLNEPDLGREFYTLFAALPALSKRASKKGEAIRMFHQSRNLVENLQRKDSNGIASQIAAVHHSLFSLIYWLYPNYPGYSRTKNALAMYKQALAATDSSVPALSEPYVVGLYIELRVLPFLVLSKKASLSELRKAREQAIRLVDESASNANRPKLQPGLVGLIFDGLGFSYYQYERDTSVSLSYLTKALENLTMTEKDLAEEMKKKGKSKRLLWSTACFYRAFTAVALCDLGISYETEMENKEGHEMLSFVRLTRSHYEKAYEYARKTPWHFYTGLSSYNLSGTYQKEAEIQVETEKVLEFLKKAVTYGEQSLRWFSLWSTYESDFVGGSHLASYYQRLARNSTDLVERKKYMTRSLRLAQKAEAVLTKTRSLRYNLVNIGDIYFHNAEYYQDLYSKSTSWWGKSSDSGELLLERALSNIMKSKKFYREERYSDRDVDASLLAGDICYEYLNIGRSKPERTEILKHYSAMAKRLCRNAIRISHRSGWNERTAESYWHLAQVFDSEARFTDSAENYQRAYESYLQAMSSTPNARFYQELAYYMLAWNRIERAKLSHRSSDFARASEFYLEASKLVSRSKTWNHGSALYRAESLVEKAESESLADKAQSSMGLFREASESLSKFLDQLKDRTPEERRNYEKLAKELLAFCAARITLERSKEDYRLGDTKKSVSGLSQAEQKFRELAESSLVFDPRRSNELASLASLCSALQSFQNAQITGDATLFLDAKRIFEEAASESSSKALKQLLIGLSNFADFLHSSKKIEESLESNLDIELVVKCNEAIENAEIIFRKLGNKSFLNMLKASKNILDASIKMGAAAMELENSEVKAKLYEQAQRSLSRASRYYELLGSSKRVKDSLRMIGAVRNHQRLIPLAHDIIAEVAANQIIYGAISSSTVFEQSAESSSSVLNNAHVVLDLAIPKQYIALGQELSFTVTLSNLGRASAITVKIDEIVPEGFEIVSSPYPVGKDRTISFTTRINPSGTKQLFFTVKPTFSGDFTWHPSLVYLDSSRNYKITRSDTGKVVVESEPLEDFSTLIENKARLEEELARMGGQENTSDLYSIKEKISKIDETLLRTKNEFDSMSQDLARIRSEIEGVSTSSKDDALTGEMLQQLKIEESILLERIERRRRLLSQAKML